ncbi:MAG: DnaJ domain-containing protein [Candidatus Methanoperedens sp.]|nr:DnaJ domain-containing protein [Candidatus Methanoperedens sp.]
MENHPDLHPHDRERENRFKLISEAYDYLTTRKSGRHYSFLRNGTVINKDSVIIYNEAGYFKWWKMTFFSREFRIFQGHLSRKDKSNTKE